MQIKETPRSFARGFLSRCYELDEPAPDFAAVFFRAGFARFMSVEAATFAVLARGVFFAATARLRPLFAAGFSVVRDASSAISTASESSGGFAVFVGAATGGGGAAGGDFGATTPTFIR